MRAIVQVVSNASVTVDSEIISKISRGLMVLVGIARDDTDADIQQIANKILSLRVFSDPSNGSMWKKNVKDIGGEILCVSQFTLLANTMNGNKPDFHRAMSTDPSRQAYISFLSKLGSLYDGAKIKDGRFGAMMSLNLTNEGPVTFTLDSQKSEHVGKDGKLDLVEQKDL